MCLDIGGPTEDLYELLEVPDSADAGEIKRSYRRLSVQYHPDKNPAQAERFNAIRDAYEILSNAEKRVLYDTGGMRAVKDGAEGKVEVGEGVERTLEVSLAELYKGTRRKITFRRRVICRRCRKTKDPQRCQGCQACPPQKRLVQFMQGNMIYQQEQLEPSSEDCKTEPAELEVTVDRGAHVGDRIVFKHMASQKPGEIPGDLTVVLKMRKEANEGRAFKRHGQDLRVGVNLTLREALLGFERKLRHLDGHTVEISTRSVTRPGQVIRIAGEGMPMKDVPSQFGDLDLVMHVEFPRTLSDSERAELEGVSALLAMEQRPTEGGRRAASRSGEL